MHQRCSLWEGMIYQHKHYKYRTWREMVFISDDFSEETGKNEWLRLVHERNAIFIVSPKRCFCGNCLYLITCRNSKALSKVWKTQMTCLSLSNVKFWKSQFITSIRFFDCFLMDEHEHLVSVSLPLSLSCAKLQLCPS